MRCPCSLVGLTVAAIVVCVATPPADADCCAGHRGGYLMLGYPGGSGLAAGRATPFAGVPNPRYAGTQWCGGPIAASAPTDYLYRLSRQQMAEQLARDEASPEEATEYASDSELMDDSPQEADDPAWSPDYPGQASAAPAAARRPAQRPPRARPVATRYEGVGAFSADNTALRLSLGLGAASYGR